MEPILLCIPKPFDNGTGEYSVNAEKKNDAFDFFSRSGIDVINSYDEKNMTWVDLQSLRPDYVIYSRPYNNQYPKEYQSLEVCKYAKVCYVPYAFSQTSGTLFETTFNTQFLSTVYITFVPSQIRLEDCRKKFVIQYWFKTNHFVYCGFPRFDLLVQKESSNQKYAGNRKTIAWLPRWIVGDGVENKKSNFFKYCDAFIHYMDEHMENQLIIRPHPLMFESIIENGIMKEEEVEQLKARLLSHANIVIDADNDYLPTLRQADILVADFTSLLIEYFVTGKPIIYCDTADGFNADAQLMDSTLYHAENWTELESLLSQSEDILYGERQRAISCLIPPNAGHIGRDILSYIVEDFQK
ncbi:MAG: CDP-glycerol glycerophosphotransferase family protein [Clostridium sp.]|nr:CDP-glycerol glycerophosphotransferase family protein [Clostridium sp.]